MAPPLHGAVLVFAALAAACGEKPAPAATGGQKDPFAITAGPALMQRLKLGEAREAEVRETLRVPGRVEVNETRVARVGSPVTGRVSELEVREGDNVTRGQILATLTSTELSNTQLEFLKALSQKRVADRAAARAQQLLDADVIGAAELQRRQAEAIQADADLNAGSDRLKVLGMSPRAIARLSETRRVDSTSHIVSSIAGTVIDRKVSPGQVVQPADTVYIIADLSEVWVSADVPEALAGTVRAGQTVEVEIPAIPDRRIRGVLSFVGRHGQSRDAHGARAHGRSRTRSASTSRRCSPPCSSRVRRRNGASCRRRRSSATRTATTCSSRPRPTPSCCGRSRSAMTTTVCGC